MFNTVLIANRGAIACRIIRTLKKLGIKSIAVYSEADKESLHVTQADEAYSLGPGAAATTYLDQDKIIEIAKLTGAQAIHPGYGFLSENATFADKLKQQNIAFIGPRAQQMIDFGLKHQAREIAEKANVPLVPGSGLISDIQELVSFAEKVGYPVMLKSTAGGGGIGMQRCDSSAELEKAFVNVKHLGAQNFANDGVFVEKFVEKARHIEVQVIGNGFGQVVTLGERDCSSQRRNQKVIEETPAANLPAATRNAMLATAKNLMASIDYLNAGTVEFIYDHEQDKFYFLEVNTRLQVEHGVTEMCYQLDLVEWMLKVAFSESMQNQPLDLSALDTIKPVGHAIQARIYAENPAKNFQPSAGLLTQVEWPTDGVRVDHWVEAGLTVSPFFDPMLAKVIVHAHNRDSAIAKLDKALTDAKVYGVITNIDYVQQILADDNFKQGKIFTRSLNNFQAQFAGFEVLKAGTMTTIQDYPARTGYWDIGVPPSGPFDFYSFRLANRLLNNPDDAAGLEITLQGPSLKFYQGCQVVITGAEIEITLDDKPQQNHQVINIKTGQTLKIGKVTAAGARAYMAVSGGIQCPDYLGSKSTFTLGQFGGHCGRALRMGDFLSIAKKVSLQPVKQIPQDVIAPVTQDWTLRVIYGPHGAPDFFTEEDIKTIQSHTWKIHYNSSRTGIRLIGPKPEWARETGGEAGLHPSNIHDNAYAFGTVDFTGDMPVILGPDGPSLGGFVCPFTVIAADLWKLGQLKAGDNLNFEVVDLASAKQIEIAQNSQIAKLAKQACDYAPTAITTPILDRLETDDGEPGLVFRAAGDKFLLVEYGELVLDLTLRARVQALLEALQAENIHGVLELTPGIRSLQIHYDNLLVDLASLIQTVKQVDLALGDTRKLSFESRIVHLPLSWNDKACQQAIDKYMQSVRKDAPWCPSNLEFIKRINGLESIEQVKDIVFNAHYLVLGLGDVYLGAPVATPLDKCHRLVTTKYNPARTWTAENSVGIGGAYMCIYGMEGPGGYQFVGRTVQMWNRYRSNHVFNQPWLLRLFDQVKYYPVSHEELMQIREDFPLGKWQPKIESATVSMPELIQQWQDNQDDIEQFTKQREQAFAAEMAEWKRTGQLNYSFEADAEQKSEEIQLADNQYLMEASAAGSVWKVTSQAGQQVASGQSMIVLESMKMEIDIAATENAQIVKVLVKEGQQVQAGQALMILQGE
ncbi:urea carboxylase [Catenovulum agarivorans]|uniref:urea carboxylase n=1 Tax=Catenovulum agarivorans TaxID=1172192 RepID=UPI00031C7D2E|nr:urea carboxylase [Catenovulum agarivorans]